MVSWCAFTVLVVLLWPVIEATEHDHRAEHTGKMSDEELESVLRRKATSVVQKMEKQLQEAYTDMLLTKVKSKRIQAEHKVEELIDQANSKLNEDIKSSSKGLKVEITPVLHKDSLQPMVSVRRTKRSGVCRPYCQHKCLPSCNLACCVSAPNKILTNEVIEVIERKIAKKVNNSKKDKISKVASSHKGANRKDAKKKKGDSVVRQEEQNQKRISKEDLETGKVCEPKCRVLCEPTCKFKCCITTYKGSA